MIAPIYIYGESILKMPAQELNLKRLDVKKDIIDTQIPCLIETMKNAHGSGLAGPQVGWSWKIFAIDAEIEIGVIFKGVFINPKILSYSGGLYTMTEGCLSLPGITASVIRPGSIELEYYDEKFDKHIQKIDGLPARIIQHEYDHLIGKLFIDHLDILVKEKILYDLVSIKQKKVKTSYTII